VNIIVVDVDFIGKRLIYLMGKSAPRNPYEDTPSHLPHCDGCKEKIRHATR